MLNPDFLVKARESKVIQCQSLKIGLHNLFGWELLITACSTDIADLDISEEEMEAVHDAVDTMIEFCGQPIMQKGLIVMLNTKVQLLLCMWIIDTGIGSCVLNQQHEVN